MLEFEHYVRTGKVHKHSKNEAQISSMISDACERMAFAKQNAEQNPRYAFEDAFEAVDEAINSLLAKAGYKSYSHEASIAFLQTKGFDEAICTRLNACREARNKSRYYGQSIDKQRALDDIDFLSKTLNRITGL